MSVIFVCPATVKSPVATACAAYSFNAAMASSQWDRSATATADPATCCGCGTKYAASSLSKYPRRSNASGNRPRVTEPTKWVNCCVDDGGGAGGATEERGVARGMNGK
jgi:hypothetical protein